MFAGLVGSTGLSGVLSRRAPKAFAALSSFRAYRSCLEQQLYFFDCYARPDRKVRMISSGLTGLAFRGKLRVGSEIWRV